MVEELRLASETQDVGVLSARRLQSAKRNLFLQVSALRSRTLDSVAHAFFGVRYRFPDAQPRRFGLSLERDVVYGPTDRTEHKLDVYAPASRAAGPLPVVMYVHGGAFAMLSKETHRVMAFAIASRGYVTFNVNYRLGPRHLYPAPLEDVATALLWVRAHAAEYGGDPERIVIAGESAGGNLVTALAVMSAYPRPEPFARAIYEARVPLRAVIATYPILDLSDVPRMMQSRKLPGWAKTLTLDAAVSYLGAHYAEAIDRAPLASPLLLLEHGQPSRPLPPFFVSCGTRDPLLAHARRLDAALERLGVDHELCISPGEIHGFDAMLWRPAARAKWKAAHAFLARTTASGARGAAAADRDGDGGRDFLPEHQAP
jgi:acetyl esterase